MTDSINNGGPAFPTHAGADWHKQPNDPTKDDPRNQILGGGMTLRDWFAGQALAGAMSTLGDVHSIRWAEVARDCYIAADNMLEVRK